MATINLERRVVIFIQARYNSYRLPFKTMLPLDPTILDLYGNRVTAKEVTILDSVKERCKQSGYPTYVLTPPGEGGDFEGPEDDVLKRYVLAAEDLKLENNDLVVRVTADCPLIDPGVIRQMVYLHEHRKACYTTSNGPQGYPSGTDVQVTSVRLLKALDKKLTSGDEYRTHVLSAFEDPHFSKLQVNVERADLGTKRYADIDYSVDTAADYMLVRELYGEITSFDTPITIAERVIKIKKERL